MSRSTVKRIVIISRWERVNSEYNVLSGVMIIINSFLFFTNISTLFLVIDFSFLLLLGATTGVS